jgi:selenocysteine lyase/cysteine desulfurase
MDAPTIDVERARADTPGVRTVAHLNNAGAALSPAPVLDAVVGHLRREAEIGGYEAAAEAHERLEHTYDAIAGLIGAATDEIAVIENATRAWDMAFHAVRLGPGDRILSSNAEYSSNWMGLSLAVERHGAVLEVVPDDEAGQVDVAALERMLDERVRLVSLVHVPTSSGLVNPAAAVGAVCRAAGVPLLLDACQSVGQLPIDVEAIGCDMLSATGRKFLRGPRGTGFLYVRRSRIAELDPPFLDLHSAEWRADRSVRVRDDARRFETWETYVAGKIGLGVACDYARAIGLEAIAARNAALATTLRNGLAAIAGVRVHDPGVERCAIVTFTVAGRPSAEVVTALRAAGVNTSVGSASSSRLDLDRRGLGDVVRASPHYYNTEAEIVRLLGLVERLARGR